jgi:general secretion pathway protein I
MRSRRGFTLLEVLVATSIMGVAVVTLLSALSHSMNNAARLTTYERAGLLARSQMDALLADPNLPRVVTFEQALDPSALGTKAGWRARLTPFEGPPGAVPGTPILERLELEVWWMANEQRRSLKLESYRRGTMRKEDLAAPITPEMAAPPQ